MTDTAEPDLSDRVIIVTGASRGIGKGLAIGLAAKGATLVCAARTVDRHPDWLPGTIHETVARIERAGGQAHAVRCDIGNEGDIRNLVDTTVDTFGRVDVLVNNAGYNVNAPMLTMKLDDYDAVAAMARATWYLTKAVLRRFMFRQGGRIINVSSVVGHIGNPGQIPYTMVKAGLDAFTKSLAQELAGRDVTVNSVAPGFIDTEMTQALPEEIRAAILARIPMQRMGRPEEVADAVVWLATRASYVHGSVVHVNGGMFGG